MSHAAKHARAPQRRKKRVGIILIGTLALALVGFAVAFTFLGMPAFLERLGKKESPDAVRPSDLSLSLSKSEFVVGEDGTTTYAVSYANTVTSDIAIASEDGTVLATISPDGSGYQTGTIALDTSAPAFPQLTAQTGDLASAPSICRVTPEVTDDMVRTLAAVAADLGDQVATRFADDPYSEATRSELVAWLKQDPRVEDAVINDDCVLFRTVDGLVGGYEAAARDKNALGLGHTVEEAWQANEAGRDVSDWTIPSGNVMTNDMVRYVSPLAEADSVIGAFRTSVLEQLQDFAGQMGYGLVASESDEEGLCQMCDGPTLTDCGLLALCTHGAHVARAADGSRLLLLYIRGWQIDGVEGMQMLEPFVEDNEVYYGTLEQPEANNALFFVSYGKEAHSFAFMTAMTSTALMGHIGLSTFDNTIIELLVCYGTSDQLLLQFLFDHGAAAVIGCHESYDCDIATSALERLTGALASTDDAGRPHTLANVKDFVGYDEKAAYRERHEGSTDDYDDYLKKLADRPARYFLAEPGRMTRGAAQVAGHVVGLAGETMPDAQVSACRWVDHDFRYHGEDVSDDEGTYELPDQPYGLYYLEAEFMDAKAHVAATFEDLQATPEDIVLPIMTVTGCVIDKQTGDPLANQKVIISWGDYLMAGKTDETGTYTIHPVTCHVGGTYLASLASDTYAAKPIQFTTDSLINTVVLTDMLAEEQADRQALLRHLFEVLVPQEQLVSYEEYAHTSSGMDYFDYDPFYQAIDGKIAGATIQDLDGDDRDEMLVVSYDVRANEDPSNMYPDVHLLARYFDVDHDAEGRPVRLRDTIDQIVSPTWRRGVYGAGLTHVGDTTHLVVFGTVYNDYSSSNSYDVVWLPEDERLALELGYQTAGLGMGYTIDRTTGGNYERVFERNNQDWESKIDIMQQVQAQMYAQLGDYRAGTILSCGKVDAAGMLEQDDVSFFALTEVRSEGNGYVGRSYELEMRDLHAEYEELE